MVNYKEMEKKLMNELKRNLTEKRLKHSIGVASCAVELATIYNEDVEKAHFAGLAHDIAKDFTREESKSIIEKYNIKLDEYEKLMPQLIHAKLGAVILEHEYGIDDEELLNSITYHTTGRKKMTKFEKIIHLADYIEKSRTFDGVEKIRILAKKNLDLALYQASNTTCIDLMSKNVIIHPNTIKSRNNLLKNLKFS